VCAITDRVNAIIYRVTVIADRGHAIPDQVNAINYQDDAITDRVRGINSGVFA
jgi:hypothetical protein